MTAHLNNRDVIIVKNLTNAFGHQKIHDGLNFSVKRGEIMGIVGGSGTGKSVLLRSILGLQAYTGGNIELLGHNMATLTAQARRDLLLNIGVLFQNGALFSSLTVLENIQLPLKEQADVSEPYLTEIALQKMTMAGLEAEAALKLPAALSGGMVKRAALARALALDPTILFLDEPTSGLDPIAARRFDGLVRHLQQTLNLTVVMVTHDLDSLFLTCDRVAVLLNKKVVVGPLKKIVELEDPWAQEYFAHHTHKILLNKKGHK